MRRQITNLQTGDILFEGDYDTDKECLEQAIIQRIQLDYADLRCKNLSQVNLDCLQIEHADFSHSNLVGANLSQAILYNVNFHKTNLSTSCMRESIIRKCNFKSAYLSVADIKNSTIIDCTFSTVSALELPFSQLRNLGFCTFITKQGESIPFDHAPITLTGLSRYPISIIGDHTLIGTKKLPKHSVIGTLSSLPIMQYS